MGLKRLDLRGFRNLGEQTLDFPAEGVAIIGDNAQGKSNLLESIYYLETFRSFRGSRDEQLVAFGRDHFRVAAELEGAGPDEAGRVAAAFQKSGRRKKVTVDGVEADRLGEALGRLAAVVFAPSDLSIVSGGPAERRRFLDIVLSLNTPGYLEALQRFRHVLSQRNAALRDEEAEAVVRAWDEALVRSGGVVIEGRRAWVARWSAAFDDYHRTVSGGEGATMTYGASADPGDAEGVESVVARYREALLDTADRERRVGNTVVGPHRDELELALTGGSAGGRPEEADDEDGLAVRAFGSGGQQRTAALALRLVEADTIREARGREPIVLLDDVFAELDPGRGERILALLDREGNQVIVTAPKESDVRIRSDRLPRWSIRDGAVSPRA